MSNDHELPISRKADRNSGFRWGCAAATVLILVIAGVVLLPAVQNTRNPPPSVYCKHKLMQLGLALHNYHDVYGCFPPAYFADEDGRPMHSWRVMVLPFLDESDVFGRYRFDEQWDSPHNRSLVRETVYWNFGCPAKNEWRSENTHYVAVVGAQTLFPGEQVRRLEQVTDGTDQTIAIVEIADSDIHWMEPRDLDVSEMSWRINPPTGMGISSDHNDSHHARGANVLFVNSRVRFLSDDLPAETVRAMLTIDGGEEIPAWDD